MSHQAVKWALEQTSARPLSPMAALLLVTLADCYNPAHGCFPSQETLTQRLHTSPRTLRRTLAVLAKQGLVRVALRGHRTSYELLMREPGGGQIWPVEVAKSGQICPGEVAKYGHESAIPPYIFLTSKEEKKGTGNLKADCAAQVGKGFSGTSTPSHEEETVKALDVVNQLTLPKPEQQVVERAMAAAKRPNGPKASELAALWRDLHALHMPNWCLNEMLRKDQAILLKAYTVAGRDFIPALAMALKHWDDFLLFIKLNGGMVDKAYHGGTGIVVPRPGFVLLRVSELVAFYRERMQPAAQPVQPKAVRTAPLTTPSEPQQTPPPLPSLDEVIAILEGRE